MPAIQTSYGDRMAAGYPGLVRNMETANSISRTIEEAAGIGFGLPVVQGLNGVVAVGSSTYQAAAAAVAGNTGTGAITAAPTIQAGVKRGTYKAIATGPTKFEVFGPDGIAVGVATVGTAFAKQLGFTISAGGTAYVEGDEFDIVVSSTLGGAFRGLTIRDQTLVTTAGQTVDVYQKGNSAGLLLKGVMWVTSGGAQRVSDPLFFNVASQQYTNNPADFPIPNGIFDASSTNAGDLTLARLNAY